MRRRARRDDSDDDRMLIEGQSGQRKERLRKWSPIKKATSPTGGGPPDPKRFHSHWDEDTFYDAEEDEYSNNDGEAYGDQASPMS